MGLAFWTTFGINYIPFGKMTANSTHLYVIEAGKNRIVRFLISELETGTVQGELVDAGISVSSDSVIDCVNNLITVTTPSGIYEVSGTDFAATLINDHTESDGSSIRVMTARQAPETSGLDSWLLTCPRIGTPSAIRRYNINSIPQPTYSGLDSDNSNLNTSTGIRSIASSITRFFAWDTVSDDSYQVNIGMAPPFAALAPVTPGGGDGVVVCATERYDDLSATGSSVPVVFYIYDADTTHVNPLPYGIGTFNNVTVPDFSGGVSFGVDKVASSARPLYMNYNQGAGRGRIGKVTGGGENGNTGNFSWVT